VARVAQHEEVVPSRGLIEAGPLVQVTFSPHPLDIELLAQEGTTWQPVSHRMMVDTGAQLTVVEDAVPKFLNLVPIRYQLIAGVTGDLDCPVYRLEIEISVTGRDGMHGAMKFWADVVAVPPVPELARPHVGLLGRDFLQYVRFEYDGPKGSYSIIDERASPIGRDPRSGSTAKKARSDRRRPQRPARRKRRRGACALRARTTGSPRRARPSSRPR
jgi:hypothetical protein